MGQIQLETKLRHLLDHHAADMEEYHVVYFMVESRKLLERDAALSKQFSLLRFYADWSLHTKKDHITPAIKAVSEKIFDMASRHIAAKFPLAHASRNDIEAFAHFDHLLGELASFLALLRLPDRLVTDQVAWLNFSDKLIRVLEEQPIVKPTGDLRSISFLPSARNAVIFEVEFVQPVNGKATYTYMNILH